MTSTGSTRWRFAGAVMLVAALGVACSSGDGGSDDAAATNDVASSTTVSASATSTTLPIATTLPETSAPISVPSRSVVGEQGVPGAAIGLVVGDCLPNGVVDVEAPFVAAETIGCTEAHLGEVVGIEALDDAADFPGDGLVLQQADRLCINVFADELGIEFRSSPLLMTPLSPTQPSWDEGDRAVLCVVTFDDPENRAIQAFDEAELLLPNGQVYSFLLAPGDCLVDEETLVEPVVPIVGCDVPHRFELYASIDLPNGDFPSLETLDTLADGVCFEEFEGYIGKEFADSGLLYRFLYPSEASWADGDRKVLCFVDAGEELTESVAALELETDVDEEA